MIRPAYTDAPGSSAPAGPADIRALQRAVRANPDNVAGPNTRSRCYALAAASNWGGKTFPFGVAFTQSVVGTEQDGIWGEASEEAHDATVEAVQAAVGAEVDGVYGAETNTKVNALLDRAEQP